MAISSRDDRPRAARVAALAAALALAVVVLPARRARAEAQLQGIGSLSLGATDNALSAPKGSALIKDDGFVFVRAGVLGLWTGQRQADSLGYSFGANHYFQT